MRITKFLGSICCAAGLAAFISSAQAELVLFYNFDDAADQTIVKDISGNGNDGEVIDAEYTDVGGGRTGGGTDRAMDFLEFNDDVYVNVPSAEDGAFDSITENDQVTLSMWINGGPDQPVDQWTFYAGPDRQLGSHIPWSNANVYFDVAGTVDSPCCTDRINTQIELETFAEEWNHYAFVKLEDETFIYQNGEVIIDGFDMREMNEITEFFIGRGPEGDLRSYHGLIDDFGVWDTALSEDEINEIMMNGVSAGGAPQLRAGDADQDLDFDQLDLVAVQIAGKYLSGTAATWGEGDWDGAPGGEQGSPPAGDGQFNQLDIISALNAGVYLTGPYAAVAPGGQSGDGQTSVGYNPGTGEVFVDAPAGVELTSVNIDSAGGIFTGDAAANLGGSFDNDADGNIFKATFGGSFGSISLGNVAQTGLSQDFVLGDLTVVGSLAGGGDLGNVDLIYVPEPSAVMLLLLGLSALASFRRR